MKCERHGGVIAPRTVNRTGKLNGGCKAASEAIQPRSVMIRPRVEERSTATA